MNNVFLDVTPWNLVEFNLNSSNLKFKKTQISFKISVSVYQATRRHIHKTIFFFKY
jgi:hypothetical protein